MNKWDVTVEGLDAVLTQLSKERNDAPSQSKQATAQAARAAAKVLQGAAAARTGFVRTFISDTPSGATVTAVGNVPFDRARVNAAAAAGVRQFGGGS